VTRRLSLFGAKITSRFAGAPSGTMSGGCCGGGCGCH
jgi:hypothetical protein